MAAMSLTLVGCSQGDVATDTSDASPAGFATQDASPGSQGTSPGSQGTSPRSQDASPRSQDASPGPQDGEPGDVASPAVAPEVDAEQDPDAHITEVSEVSEAADVPRPRSDASGPVVEPDGGDGAAPGAWLASGAAGARLTSETHTLWLTVPSRPVGIFENINRRLWLWAGAPRPD